MVESAIATARATPTPTSRDPFLDELFAGMDAMAERLTAAQDAEQASHDPVDLDGAAEGLAEERAALLVAGANTIDAIMSLAELGIAVQRQLAGVEAAATMRLARVLPQPAIDPPPPPDPYDDGGDNTEDFHTKRRAS